MPSRPARRIIDLTLPIDDRLPGANVFPHKSIDQDGWRATMLELYSHCGTHIDATCHFLPRGQTLEQVNLEACCGLSRVVDLSPVEPSQLLTVEQFRRAAGEEIQPGERLLLRTDWSRRYPSDEYRNALPRISVELARWFVERQVRLIGVEPPSVADVNNIDEVTEVHQILFSGGVVIVEGLIQLDKIEAVFCEFYALPLRIVGGDGCPVRAIAIVPGVDPEPTTAFGFDRQAKAEQHT